MGRDDGQRQRAYWRGIRRGRPGRVVEPGPGQESVWDYPRPPRVEADHRRIRVRHAGVDVADSRRALRVLETAGPPCFYLPPQDVRRDLLEPSPETTFCEWKGLARYWSLGIGDRRVVDAAWSYPDPEPAYERLRDHLAFFPGRVDECFVGLERARPQPGSYYGGWVTPEIVGPFKGEPGSESW
jgi:uncharacterized protein (DUF427 family)